MPRIDLNPHDWDEVSRILRIHVPGYEVWAFGSRVTWSAKQYSDLDLAVITKQPLPLAVSADLKNAFEESSLSIKVDVVDWATTAESFRRIIEKDKVIVQVPQPGLVNWTFKRLIECTRDGNLSYGIVQPGQHDDEGIPIIRVNNVNNGQLRLDDVMRVSPEIEAKYKRTRLEGGEVLLTLVGSTGQSVVVPNELAGWNIARAIAVIRPRPEIGANWINICLQSKAVQQFLDERANTTVQKTLNLGDVKELPIPIPPREVKDAIESVAMALANKIELNRRMNETLEAIARAMFKSWFVDFDPVRAKMSGEPPESICQRLGLTPDLLTLFPDRLVDSELGEIPEGWSASTLGSHIEIFDSKRVPLSNREREKRKGTYPYYGATSVMDHVDDYIFDGIYVLIGEDGSVVKENGEPFLQYVWGKFWVNNHAHVLQAKKPVSNEYLLLMLKQTNVASFVTGAVQLKISQGNLKRIPFVSAPGPINENFANIIAPFFDMIRAREDEIRTLTDVHDEFLPKLLSGELRVPKADKTLEVAA